MNVNPDRLRDALRDQGMTVSELAEHLGVSRGFVSQWLNQHRDVPVKYVDDIVSHLRVDRGWLTGGGTESTSASDTDEEARVTEDASSRDVPVRDGAWSFRPAPPDGGRDYGSANIWTLPADLETLVRETGQNSLDHVAQPGGQVHMRFSVIELTKGSREYEAFSESVHFDALREHLEEASKTKSKLATRLKGGVKRLERAEKLRLLRIDDYGTTGLFGSESTTGREENNPFASLVRNNLDSSKQTSTAGGSFGLGKAVLWRCSDLSTVLFASDIAAPKRAEGQPEAVRFIGKTELTWHALEENECAGPGWLGKEVQGTPGRSMWVDNADLDVLQLSRAPDRHPPGVDPTRASGTSILVLAFQDPQAEDEPDPSTLLDQIAEAAAVNFWPIMVKERLWVSTEYLLNGQVKEQTPQVDPTDYVFELCDALLRHEADEVEDDLVNSGDVVRVDIPHRVPATEDDKNELRPFPNELEATCQLVVRLAGDEEVASDQLDSVALVRGRGMVVRYWPRRNIVVGARPFHAVLLAGRAAGTDSPQVAADQFLRLSEPPAHDRWEYNAEIKEKYEWGAGTRLKEMFQAVSDELGTLLKPRQAGREEGPSELKRLLQLTASSRSESPTATLRQIRRSIEDDRWTIHAEIHMNERSERWAVSPRLRVDAESGKKIRIPWEHLEVIDVGRGSARLADGGFLIDPGTRRVKFRARTEALAEGVRVAECRTLLDLQVSRVGEGEEAGV